MNFPTNCPICGGKWEEKDNMIFLPRGCSVSHVAASINQKAMPRKNQVQLEVRKDGNYSDERLVFAGGLWDEWDFAFCIHGEKLRWGCDECEELFKTRPELFK